VLFLDLDRFKIVNDSLGHETGDQLLVETSRRLKACLRPGDMAARFGGDEFTVLLDSIRGVDDATMVAERIASALTTPFDLGGHEVHTTTSVGIVLSHAGGERAEELLRDADVAMYRAKSKGRARYEVFDLEMSSEAFERLRMEIDLRQALKRGQLRLHFQPLVGLSTGGIVGCEALVRWEHPDRGLVPPNDFIALAEETNIIVPLGAWVIHETCRQARRWRDAHFADRPFHVSVNLSARQFQQPGLVEEVSRALSESGLEPNCLNLEITESVMMVAGEAVVNGLASLRALGVQLSLDDFGTGFSSLSYLKEFPLDTLKVDRSFVNGTGTDAQDAAIVQAVHSLARALGMKVVAEGIETADQLDRLRAMSCDIGQGYYFSKPLTPEAFERLVQSHPRW
jgi:diguanylate cyclase (GGDEF)-like protein